VGDVTVTVDGRILRDPTTGTQVHTLALIGALARTGSVRLRVIVPETPWTLEALPGVELVSTADVGRGVPPTAIVHRPYQVTNADDLLFLRAAGDRVVVTHQDLIGFHNASYHATADVWHDFRRVTRAALSTADAVVVFSQHAAGDLRAEDLVPDGRVHVVPGGTDHAGGEPAGKGQPLDVLGGRPFLLCLGADLRHKNRPFALDVVAALRARGWDGGLVLAGPHAELGSSREDERRRLADPALADRVVDLGAVDEDAKRGLYATAAAAIFPSTYEGFGLIPFEAAAAGKPSLFAPVAALAELLPAEAAALVPWDAEASADRALELLCDPDAARRQVATVRDAGRLLTWDRTARKLLAVYERALAEPTREAAAVGWTALEIERRRHVAEHAYRELDSQFSGTGRALVGRCQLLPEEEQHALAGLLERRATRAPTLAALRLARSAARLVRRS